VQEAVRGSVWRLWSCVGGWKLVVREVRLEDGAEGKSGLRRKP